jgi:four helix bundle protein
MAELKGLETLLVWQKAMALTVMVQQQILPVLPDDEKWALVAQLRRSVQSIPANIAEGYGRYYYQEGVRFCYLARGSLEETYNHLSLSYKHGYISQDTFNIFNGCIQEIHRLLNGYITFLKKSKQGENEPGSTHKIQEDPNMYSPDPDSEDTL